MSRPKVVAWPAAAPAALFLSFDVDGESALLHGAEENLKRPITMSQARYGPKVGVYEILRVLHAHAVPATFFIPGWVAENYPEVVKAVVADGHEVGLHGYLHERADLLSDEEIAAVTKRSIEILGGISGNTPIGYRAPGPEVSPSTTAILAQHGVRYSSSYMDDVFPYYHETEHGRLLELPIHWANDDWPYSMLAPYALPAPHLNTIVTPEHISSVWSAELDAVTEMGGLHVLVAHPQVTGRPGRLGTLKRLIEHAEEAGLWIAAGREIQAFWDAELPTVPTGVDRLMLGR